MLLFLDESGTDHKETPYEVIGGIAIHERDLWNFVQDVAAAQDRSFGGRLRDLLPSHELKGKQLLSRDKFKYANQGNPFPPDERRALAFKFLERGLKKEPPKKWEFTAYGQACLAYVEEMLDMAVRFNVKVFASVVLSSAPQPASDEFLGRELAFLFERYFYYLEEFPADTRGLIVFDELEKSLCRKAIRRIEDYFLRTGPGRLRSSRIIPEPFFVHSDLTTGTQTADVVVYIINWAYRFGGMSGPIRTELSPFTDRIQAMVHRTSRVDEEGIPWPVWGVKYIDDRRPASERA